MRNAFWFFLAAIAYSFFALHLMLDRPTPNKDRSYYNGNSSQAKPADAKSGIGNVGFPAASGKNQAAGKPTLKASQPPQVSPENQVENKQLGLISPSGIYVADGTMIDMQVIESQMLAEQVAESLRNPAYLLGVSIEASGQTDPEEMEEAVEDSDADQAIEVLDETKIGDSEIEEETPDYSEYYAAEADVFSADEGKSGDHVFMTEAGIPIGSEAVDFNEIEERILNAQLEESQRNPAYLQATAEEPPPE
jgi:hypothetical protein